MKAITKILALTLLTLVTHVALATGGEEKKSNSTDPKEIIQQDDKKNSSKSLEDGENSDFTDLETSSLSDSTDDESLSKHNFIFYLLYKMRYNEDQKLEALF